MHYNFREIEKKWTTTWKAEKTYKITEHHISNIKTITLAKIQIITLQSFLFLNLIAFFPYNANHDEEDFSWFLSTLILGL